MSGGPKGSRQCGILPVPPPPAPLHTHTHILPAQIHLSVYVPTPARPIVFFHIILLTQFLDIDTAMVPMLVFPSIHMLKI